MAPKTPIEHRRTLLAEAEGWGSVRAFCRKRGLSPATYYRWLHRQELFGDQGLADRSRRPRSHPKQTPEPVVRRLLRLVQAEPALGCVPLARRLASAGQGISSPTVQKILIRHGLGRRQQRQAWAASSAPKDLPTKARLVLEAPVPRPLAQSFDPFALFVYGIPSRYGGVRNPEPTLAEVSATTNHGLGELERRSSREGWVEARNRARQRQDNLLLKEARARAYQGQFRMAKASLGLLLVAMNKLHAFITEDAQDPREFQSRARLLRKASGLYFKAIPHPGRAGSPGGVAPKPRPAQPRPSRHRDHARIEEARQAFLWAQPPGPRERPQTLGMELKAIAGTLGLSYPRLRRIARQDGWESLRQSMNDEGWKAAAERLCQGQGLKYVRLEFELHALCSRAIDCCDPDRWVVRPSPADALRLVRALLQFLRIAHTTFKRLSVPKEQSAPVEDWLSRLCHPDPRPQSTPAGTLHDPT